MQAYTMLLKKICFNKLYLSIFLQLNSYVSKFIEFVPNQTFATYLYIHIYLYTLFKVTFK